MSLPALLQYVECYFIVHLKGRQHHWLLLVIMNVFYIDNQFISFFLILPYIYIIKHVVQTDFSDGFQQDMSAEHGAPL